MKYKLFLFFLLILVTSTAGVSATKTGNITGITYDITSRPYYITENPAIDTSAKNTGTENYDAYIKIFVTAPDGTSHEYDTDVFSLSSGFSVVATTNFDKLSSEGIGTYTVRSELWRNIDWWPDEKLDTEYSNFDVIFNKPSGYDNYLQDNSWHHPSDSYIRSYALSASAGATSVSSATQKLNDWVHNYISYTQSFGCDGDNSACGDRSQDYWILYDRKGDCNDFADLFISLAEAINIPTRGLTIEWVNNSLGDNWIDYGPRQWLSGHAIAESLINQNWVHIDPTGDDYNDPLQYLQGRYISDKSDHIISRAWTSSLHDEISYLDSDQLNLRNGWTDVTQDRPYDNTWIAAGLSVSSWASSYSPYYGNNITVYTRIFHIGDMTARNTRASISYASGLGLVSGANPQNIGNLTWKSANQTISWVLNAQSVGQKNIVIYISSNDTSPLTLSLPINVLDRDDDNDGINNSLDSCPNQKGFSCNNGCPDTIAPEIIINSPLPTRYPYRNISIMLDVSDNQNDTIIVANQNSNSPKPKNNQNDNIFSITSNQDRLGCLSKVWMFNGTTNISINISNSQYYTFPVGNNSLIFYANDSSGNIGTSAVSFFVNLSRIETLCSAAEVTHNCSYYNSVYSIDSFTINSSEAYRNETIKAIINWTGWHFGDPNYWAFFLGSSQLPIKTCTSFEQDYNINNSYSMECLLDLPFNTTLGNQSLIVTSNDYLGYCIPNENNTDAQKKLDFLISCKPNWVKQENFSLCTVNDTMYKDWVDTNSCGNNSTKPAKELSQCDFCTPNWTDILTCKEDDSIIKWSNDTKDCFRKTELNSDLEGRTENITYSFSCDFDKDGFIGNLSNINTTIQNITKVKSNDTFEFREGNSKIFFFEFNTTNDSINLANLIIDKNSENSSFAYILIKGLDLTSQNKTKTAYLNRILNGTGVCIKDDELSSISEISDSCTSVNETWLSCPGIGGQYFCNLTANDSLYVISGLANSGVKEQATYCGDRICNGIESCGSCSNDCGSCPSTPQPSGGGGGGGSSSVTTQSNKTTNQTTVKTENQTSTTQQAQNAISSGPANQTNTNQPTNKGSFITGAVTGIREMAKNNWYYILIFVLVIVGTWFGVNYIKIRQNKSSKHATINKPTNKKSGDINITQQRCPNCGKINSRWRRFCSHCNTSLRF